MPIGKSTSPTFNIQPKRILVILFVITGILSLLHIISSLCVALAHIPLDSIQYSFLSRLDQNQEVGLAT